MRYVEVPLDLQTRRVVSLDALRGFNFIWILGGEGVVLALADMSRDKSGVLGAVGGFLHTQITHAAWEGFTFYDLIFPLFIFITGVAITLSLPRLIEREGRREAHLRILRRALLLYGLGVIYYGGISQHWGDVRLVGVLQRIAVGYLAASLLFMHLNWRGLVVSLIVLLGGYWALMTFVPVPGVGAGSFAPDANLANWIDRNYLPGRLWDVTRDPEGLLSTLPAIGTCIIGVLCGLVLKDERLAPARKSLVLIGAGVVMLTAGYLWSPQFPIVKALWTSSFVLVAGGWSAILLGLMHQIVDVRGYKAWSTAFVWIGANAILLYFLNGILGFEPLARRFVGGDFGAFVDTAATPGTARLLSHSLALVFVVALAGYLYRRKIFLRV
jgi:predicted acyltransferase